MITVWTRLYCRDCKEVIKARSRETAMVEWVRMVAEEKGWIEINIGGGLKRYLCPNCQQDYEPGDPGKQMPEGVEMNAKEKIEKVLAKEALTKQKKLITKKLKECGMDWSVWSEKYLSPSDGPNAMATYHILPDARDLHTILRFSSLSEIEEYIAAIQQSEFSEKMERLTKPQK